MLNLKVIICVLVVLLTSSTGFAQTTSSWTGFVYNSIEFGENQKPDQTKLRVRIDQHPSKNSCKGGLLEIDLVDASKSYIHQAWIACQVNDWSVKTGRLFSSALKQSPPPFILKTARYQNSWSYAAYAYGIQIERKLDKGWQVGVDLTGRSGLKYNETSELFSRVEGAGRILRKGKVWAYGGAVQVSSDFFRVGIDGERQFGKLTTNAMVGYTTERRHIEGFAFTEYPLTNWLLPHVQLEVSKGQSPSVMFGLALKVRGYVYVVGDHDNKQGFMARVQFMIRKS